MKEQWEIKRKNRDSELCHLGGRAMIVSYLVLTDLRITGFTSWHAILYYGRFTPLLTGVICEAIKGDGVPRLRELFKLRCSSPMKLSAGLVVLSLSFGSVLATVCNMANENYSQCQPPPPTTEPRSSDSSFSSSEFVTTSGTHFMLGKSKYTVVGWGSFLNIGCG